MQLDKNTILSLNKDPKSIDLHNLALAKMNNVQVDNTARHAFIKDRQRTKNIKNLDDLYRKLNELEKNGVMDIWINKFGKKKYQGVGSTAKKIKQSMNESIEITKEILITENSYSIIVDKNSILRALHEDGGSAVPIAPMASGTPQKNKVRTIRDTYAVDSATHQDQGAIKSSTLKRKG